MLSQGSTKHLIHYEMKEEVWKILLWKVDVQAIP